MLFLRSREADCWFVGIGVVGREMMGLDTFVTISISNYSTILNTIVHSRVISATCSSLPIPNRHRPACQISSEPLVENP